MKYLIIFTLCLVALAAANPQVLAWPGFVAPIAPRTVVAGPTVVNGGLYGERVVSPGFVASGLF